MQNVCHFLRKSSQLRASFINNQISMHKRYTPFVVYRIRAEKEYDGGHADFKKELLSLDLNASENSYERVLYKYPKMLSQKHQREIKDFLKSNEISVLHFHYGTDCGVYYPLLKRLKVPSIVSFYGYDISSFPSFMAGFGKKYLQNRVFKWVDKVLAMSEDMKLDLLQAGCPENKIIVHYYGTDCNRFYFERQYPIKEVVTIFTLSNMCPKKGHIFQFQAINKLLDSGITNFQFRIAGTGESESELRAYVTENGLDSHIVFLGALKYASDEMMNEFRKADIFLHPSVIAPDGDKEGIPGTIIEAMSSGLPVVSTYHAGIPLVIENNQTGLLVNEWDVESLTNALAKLLNDVLLREKIGRSSQKYALENLDLMQKEKELERIYDNLLLTN